MEKRKQDKINSKKLIVSLLFFVAFITFAIFIYRTIELSTSKEIDGINLQSLAKKRTTKKEIITIIRATHKYKDSREQFEVRTHKRLIDILEPSAKTVDSLIRLDLPAGIEIEIKK